MKDLLNQIETLTTSFMKDASSQLDKGNKAAGLRARRASLEPLLKRFRKLSLAAAASGKRQD
ncbi:histone H1 [uncultured Muribaculum sp.]|uniref:histone H1 n=1 Tax=uncultured Muribaculum sp. TaxID=1918613 RepID=UPI0025A5A509|nr:histone H1 [uncultured Muribaculum sp.]